MGAAADADNRGAARGSVRPGGGRLRPPSRPPAALPEGGEPRLPPRPRPRRQRRLPDQPPLSGQCAPCDRLGRLGDARPASVPTIRGIISIALVAGLATAALLLPGAAGGRSTLPRGDVVLLGHSVKGRAVKALRLGDPGAARKALVVGVIHGDETAGTAVVRTLRRRFAGLHGVDVWTVYTVNPDGVARSSRRNARGVDLNRNFSFRWVPSSPASNYYGGPRPFS